MIVEDGTGAGYKAKVDKENMLGVRAVSEPFITHRAVEGSAYNVNSGEIAFTTAGTLIYFKNNEKEDFIITSLAVGVNSLGTHSDIGEVLLVRNPTGGDLITDATAIDYNINRNFGSSTTITADVYKGKSGGTLTGGAEAALFYQGANGRLFASINFVLPKGTSVGVKYEPNLSSGTVTAYGALIGYRAEEF
jgi:hypothetical protein